MVFAVGQPGRRGGVSGIAAGYAATGSGVFAVAAGHGELGVPGRKARSPAFQIGRSQHADHQRTLAVSRRLSADPELFFPISYSGKAPEQVAEAKAICAACPVRRECLAFALRTQQFHGIWGGMTEEERAARLLNIQVPGDTH